MFKLFRKLLEKLEETQLVQSYEHLQMFLPMVEQHLPSAEHCGDIERTHIYKFDALGSTFYVASPDKKTIFGYYQLNGNEILGAYVTPQMRGQNLTAMFFLFLKQSEGIPKLVIGDKQSIDMMSALKKIHNRFDTHWVNGDKKLKYDPSTADQFYSAKQSTGWQVVLEHDNAAYWATQPKYFIPHNLGTWYHSQIDDNPNPIIYEGKLMFWPDPF